MEESYRNNVLEFSMIYLGKKIDSFDIQKDFEDTDFTNFIFRKLFNIDINVDGYGLDCSTKQMTNNIGDLKIYNEGDHQKLRYLEDINKGDLIFFHEQALEYNSPTPNNRYPGHVGIYLGNMEFIHVSDEDYEIVIDKLDGRWLKRLVASRDIIKGIMRNLSFNK